MDKISIAVCLASILLISSCGQKKTMDRVFPDAKGDKSGASDGQCEYQKKIHGQYIVQWEDSSITVEREESLENFISDFVTPQLAKIRRVEFDSKIFLRPERANTPLSSQSAGLETWGQDIIEVAALWDQGLDGLGAVVAVIDSGADTFHSQLTDKIAYNLGEIDGNGVDDDGNGLIDDFAGFDFFNNSGQVVDVLNHGTHVSGIIAGGSPGENFSGVAYKAKILPINFMGADGGGSISDAIKAIEYAVSRKVDIINASWGGAPCSQLLGEAIRLAGESGVLFVAAAGNNTKDIGLYPEFPAAYNHSTQITVGASTVNHFMSSFTNYNHKIVHVMAPGVDIFSTLPNESHAFLRGTSMAAPFVSGVAAILKGAYPSATPLQIKRAILESVDSGPFAASSGGRLNAKRAQTRLSQILVQRVP